MGAAVGLRRARGYVERYSGWAAKVSSALIDQALFSGSGFVINVLLARWMAPEEYGAYVVAFSWFLLAQNLYDAALVEPMAVFGPGKFAPRLRTYLKYLLYAHGILSVLIAVGLAVGALTQRHLPSAPLYAALIGTAFSTPFLLLRWLTRQPFYVISRPHLVIPSGMMYLLLSVGGLLVLNSINGNATAATCADQTGSGCGVPTPLGLNAFWAQIALAAAALPPSLYNIWRLARCIPSDPDAAAGLRIGTVITQHVGYGKWSVSTRFLVWAADQLYYLILPLLGGLAATASLRALNNLVLPVYLSMGAISSILIPTFVRVNSAEGKPGLDRKVRTVMLLAAFVGGVYFLAIVALGYPVINLLYDGKYNEVAAPLILIFTGLSPIMSAAGMAYAAALRAMERIREAVQSHIVTAVFTLTLGLLCTVWFGIQGAVIATFLSHSIGVAVVMRAYYAPRTSSARPQTEAHP
jgi:O-antigen/teichoic acid export membrane protein